MQFSGLELTATSGMFSSHTWSNIRTRPAFQFESFSPSLYSSAKYLFLSFYLSTLLPFRDNRKWTMFAFVQHHSRIMFPSLVTAGLLRKCVCVCVCGVVTHTRVSKPFSLSTFKWFTEDVHLSLQLARRHGQTDGRLLAEGPGHQQTFILHLLQAHHHLIEAVSTTSHMERHHSHRNAVRFAKRRKEKTFKCGRKMFVLQPIL